MQSGFAPAKTPVGGLAREAGRFLTGFEPALRAAKVAGLGAVGGGMAAGAASDFVTAAPDQSRLSDLWKQAGLPDNVLTDWLAQSGNENDSEAEKRFKTAVEGAGFGALTEGVILAARGLRSAARAKPAQVVEDIAPALTDRDFLILGDPNKPLLEITTKAEPEALAAKRRSDKIAAGMEATEGIDAAAAAKGLAEDARLDLRIAKGEARYVEIDGTSYVAAEGGATDLARMPAEAAQAGIAAAPIRLPKGYVNENTGGGRGELHIERDHGGQIRRLGYADAAEFVADVAARFNELRRDPNGNLFLVLRDPTSTGSRKTQNIDIVQVVQSSDGMAYDVVTAGPFTNAYIEKRELLWQGERIAPTQPSGQVASSFTRPREQSGSAKPLSAGGQSGENIGDRQVFINFARINEPAYRYAVWPYCRSQRISAMRGSAAKAFGP